MTTIISRLYESPAAAEAVVASLENENATSAGVEIITGAQDIEARICALDVPPSSAALYAPHIKKGAALVVARAEFAPIGIAQRIIGIVDDAGPIDVGIDKENAYLAIEPSGSLFNLSILSNHPKFLSYGDDIRQRGRVSDAFGIRMLSTRPRKNSVMSGTRHIIPMQLLSTKPRKKHLTSGGPVLGGRAISRR